MRSFPRLGQRFGAPRSGEAGYALPLALAGSLVLLLTSLSTLGTTLHGRRLLASERSERIEADALASAAQQVTAALQGPFHCLLPVGLDRWQLGALPLLCQWKCMPKRRRCGFAFSPTSPWSPASQQVD